MKVGILNNDDSGPIQIFQPIIRYYFFNKLKNYFPWRLLNYE